jgi:hypothetical protein
MRCYIDAGVVTVDMARWQLLRPRAQHGRFGVEDVRPISGLLIHQASPVETPHQCLGRLPVFAPLSPRSSLEGRPTHLHIDRRASGRCADRDHQTGVSRRAAEVILAEVGADPTRFPTAADVGRRLPGQQPVRAANKPWRHRPRRPLARVRGGTGRPRSRPRQGHLPGRPLPTYRQSTAASHAPWSRWDTRSHRCMDHAQP